MIQARVYHSSRGPGLGGQVPKPIEYCENSGQDVPPAGGCGSAPGAASLTFFGSTLQCDPVYLDWSTFGTIHLFHEFIAPQADYSVQAIDGTCNTADEASYSGGLLVTMNIWGDMGGPYNAAEGEWEAPDGRVDITIDVTAVLDKFRNLATAPTKARAEIEPSVIDMVINISDVTFVLNAFGGSPYPFTPSTTNPCP